MFCISVIIPTYKPQEYIYECLNSLKKQNFPKNNFEIVLILNGEYIPYYDMVTSYINNELAGYNIKFYYTDVSGVSNARNIGIDQSTGKYIAFIDDDDIVSENYLQSMYNIATNTIMPLTYMKAFTRDISDTTNYYITNVYERMIHKKVTLYNTRSFFSSACYKLIDRNIIADRRFDIRFQNGEDSLFMFLISDKIKKIQFTDKNAIYFRRIRENSLTTRKKKKNLKIKNRISLVFAYTLIYLRKPLQYNFLFYVSRIIANFKIKL